LRTFAIAVLTLLASICFALGTEAPDVRQLQDQLKKVQDAGDNPAMIELSRIVAIALNDSETWDTLAQTSRAKN
jgi:hypothetical protein